jgi:probable F420-dependent oxidoreductase
VDHVRRLAELLEREHCESVWIGDHPARGRDRDDREFPSPLEWLTVVAAHSTALLLGTAVLVLPAQHPIVLAKRIATLDRLSNGRLIVGVGIGSSRSETDALGIDWVRRAAVTTESIEVMRTVWTADRGASFDGRFFTFHDVDPAPRPAQPLGPRITIGGDSLAAARRAGRLGHGLIPLGCDPEVIASLLAEARKEAEHGGWDTDAIELTVSFDRDPAVLRRLLDIGAVRFVLDAPPSGDLDELQAAIGEAQRLLAPLA